MESAYSISVLTSDKVVSPGESLEIEVYLHGYGIPNKNKLQISYSTLEFIDPINPGYIEVSGKPEGDKFKFGDKYKLRQDVDIIGTQIGLASSWFHTFDEYQGQVGRTPNCIVPMVMTEMMIESSPQFSVISIQRKMLNQEITQFNLFSLIHLMGRIIKYLKNR